MTLKLRRYIFDLVHMKLSLRIFFILSCLMESLSHHLSGYTLIFVKKKKKKKKKKNVAPNLTCGNGLNWKFWSVIYALACKEILYKIYICLKIDNSWHFILYFQLYLAKYNTIAVQKLSHVWVVDQYQYDHFLSAKYLA